MSQGKYSNDENDPLLHDISRVKALPHFLMSLISLAAPYIDGSNLFQLIVMEAHRHSPSVTTHCSSAKSKNCRISSQFWNLLIIWYPLKERLYALESFYGKYEVHIICEVLDVDRSTFYNHMLRSKRENAWFEKRRKEYCRLIRDVFDEYHRVLGAEKIRTILTQRRYYVSAAYIARLMREMNSAVFERQRSRNIWKCVSQSARKTFFGSNPVPSGRTKDGLVMSPVSSSETTISIFAWLPTSSLAE